MNFAICQEVFEDWDWERQCAFVAETGYAGIEIAPFTLAKHPQDLTSAKREELRNIAENQGLQIIGLHWLLAKTEGIHLTSLDPETRRRTVQFFKDLTDLCRDLQGSFLVLGSPLQRSLQPGVTREQGFQQALGIFEELMPHLEKSGVDLLIEPLSHKDTDFITTCDEGAELIRAVNHPNFAMHQDVKAMLAEDTPLPELIHKYADVTRHFHTNDGNLLGPGMGDVDFTPIFQALKETGYDRWVSVEVFDYRPGPEVIARESLRYMQEIADKVGWKYG